MTKAISRAAPAHTPRAMGALSRMRARMATIDSRMATEGLNGRYPSYFFGLTKFLQAARKRTIEGFT
jgi:hypothetical protein